MISKKKKKTKEKGEGWEKGEEILVLPAGVTTGGRAD